MPEKNANKWMEFLKPVVIGLCALMSAATMYLQRTDSADVETRIAKLETRAEVTDKRSDAFSRDIDNFKAVLGDIRSDVAFIRGKMEAGK